MKKIIATILQPFATASALLLIVLGVLEYLRPGFVTLFLDLRIVLIVTIVLWTIVAAIVDEPLGRLGATVGAVFALAVAALVLYKLTVPYGRLGLVVFLAGLAGFVVIAIMCVRRK